MPPECHLRFRCQALEPSKRASLSPQPPEVIPPLISTSQISALRQRLSNLAQIPKLSQAPNPSNSSTFRLHPSAAWLLLSRPCFWTVDVTEQWSPQRRLYVPGGQHCRSMGDVECIPSRRKHQQAARGQEAVCWGQGVRRCEWVTSVLDLEEVSGMVPSGGGGRKAQVKGARNKGAERRLEPGLVTGLSWEQGERGRLPRAPASAHSLRTW